MKSFVLPLLGIWLTFQVISEGTSAKISDLEYYKKSCRPNCTEAEHTSGKVCGDNGRLYMNECERKCHNKKPGECQDGDKCRFACTKEEDFSGIVCDENGDRHWSKCYVKCRGRKEGICNPKGRQYTRWRRKDPSWSEFDEEDEEELTLE